VVIAALLSWLLAYRVVTLFTYRVDCAAIDHGLEEQVQNAEALGHEDQVPDWVEQRDRALERWITAADMVLRWTAVRS
jgi:hypothetical protein